jgi:hypothetical protein
LEKGKGNKETLTICRSCPIAISMEIDWIRSPKMEINLSNESDGAPSGSCGKLPFGIGDALSLLDHIPIWKRVKELPDKMAAIEKRLAALEAKPQLPICEACGEGFMRRQADAPLTGQFAVFNAAGGGLKVYRCDKCEFETREKKT